jgi:glycosyltransferase involved in cell wall biosynthesis
MKQVMPDFCFFYTIKPNIYGSILASWMKVPYIAITTGLGYTFVNNNFTSKMAKLLYKFSFMKAPEIWFLNEDDKKTFLSEKLIKPHQAVVLRGEGVDLARFQNTFEQKEDKNVSFILLARMLWDKGIGEYVEAAKIIKQKYKNVEFKLLGFIGVDNPSAIPEKQIYKWDATGIVHYLGITDDTRKYISDSSCVVLPSYYREGVPLSLLEGAAMGKPLITTNTVGCREAVDDGVTGFICALKNVRSLADAMEQIILMSDTERINMGLKGRQKMEIEFDIKIVIQQYIDTLNRYLHTN